MTVGFPQSSRLKSNVSLSLCVSCPFHLPFGLIKCPLSPPSFTLGVFPARCPALSPSELYIFLHNCCRLHEPVAFCFSQPLLREASALAGAVAMFSPRAGIPLLNPSLAEPPFRSRVFHAFLPTVPHACVLRPLRAAGSQRHAMSCSASVDTMYRIIHVFS